jgi:hypothetical protein
MIGSGLFSNHQYSWTKVHNPFIHNNPGLKSGVIMVLFNRALALNSYFVIFT